MTAVLDAARLVELGFCPSCYALGQPVPVVTGQARCRTHLVAEGLVLDVDRSGQVRLGVPAQARRRRVYPTGQQAPCVRCEAAGVDRQGLSRDGAGSDPLCMSCWQGPRERRAAGERRRLVADLRERLDVDEPVGCAACGSPEPVPECWLCGWSWLVEADAAQEAADAAEAAVVAERFARIAAVTAAEARVDELREWADRLRLVLDAFAAEPSKRAAWSVEDRPAQAVWHLAEALCRDAAARSTRRGRPPVESRRVWGVLAVSARWSGRGAMPGREESARRAGTVVRVVTEAWARAEALGWAERTEQGGHLSLEERIETGRARSRAVFDLSPLHRGDVAGRDAYAPAALAILADLAEHAGALLAEAEADLDAARARADGWTERPEQVRRIRMRAVVAATVTRTRDLARAALTPTPTSPDSGQDIDRNFLPPHAVHSRLSVYSSSSRGFSPSLEIASPSRRGGRRSRGEIGASRSPAEAGRTGRGDLGCGGSPRERRPRSAQTACAGPRARRARPGWTHWAPGLARALPGHWTWLRGVPLYRIAATIGPRLGPAWTEATAGDLVAFVDRARPVPVLSDPHSPLGYLARILDEAMASGEQPPYPAALAEAHQREQEAARRAMVAARAAAQRERQDVVRADRAVQEQAAVRPGQRSAAAEAALAAVRARTSGRLRRGDRAALLDTTGAGDDWPEVAQPGAGLPSTLDR